MNFCCPKTTKGAVCIHGNLHGMESVSFFPAEQPTKKEGSCISCGAERALISFDHGEDGPYCSPCANGVTPKKGG